jgi:hypothetical protein
MTTTRRRLRAATLLALPLLLASLTGLTACGDDADADTDGVASIDEDNANDEGNGDDSGDGGGATDGERPMNDPEMQDAMLEYAECMREHGVDMPDPEFSDDGGVRISAGPADGEPGSGPSEEEFEAADEACQPIIEDVMPDTEIDPEQQAEMQDHLVEVAECMREKGYDMPDPEVDENGRVTMRGGPGEGGRGGQGPGPGDDQFEEDMEDCGGGPGGFRGGGGDDGEGDDDDEGPETDTQTDDSDSGSDSGEGDEVEA